MSSAVEIIFDDRQLRSIERMLKGVPNGMRRVMPRSINRAAAYARTQTSRKVRDKTGLKYGEILKRIHVSKATSFRWAAVIRLSDKRFPLIDFDAEQTGTGVAFKGPRGIQELKHGFIRNSTSSGKKVALRRARSDSGGGLVGQYPIFKRYGYSIAGFWSAAPQIVAETMRVTMDLGV